MVKLSDSLTPSIEFLRIRLGVSIRSFEVEKLSFRLPHCAFDVVAFELQQKHLVCAFKAQKTMPPKTASDAPWRVSSIPLESTRSKFDLNSQICFSFLREEMGKQLEFLEIGEPRDGAVLQAHLEAIAQFCPRLHTLVITKDEGGFGLLGSFPKLGISRLGYRISGDRASQDWEGWDWIFELLIDSCLLKATQNLEAFHVVSP